MTSTAHEKAVAAMVEKLAGQIIEDVENAADALDMDPLVGADALMARVVLEIDARGPLMAGGDRGA